MSDPTNRAGHFVLQREGYRAFIPLPLPPEPPCEIDEDTARLLSHADRALGRLDGVSSVLPSPDFFVAMYVRFEAVLSSQIEGTQSTLEDVIDYETDHQDTPKDVEEVVNYIAAMNHGLHRLREDQFPLTLTLTLRLITEIHQKLLAGTRGSQRNPGEFRRSQNWIGSAGCTLATASYLPPPVPEMTQALGDLEKFIHQIDNLPALIHCGLIHAQFETIHPFLDGNGRVGRLLITFLLCQRDILRYPLLYLSHYFKMHRAEYYDRLTAIRMDGDWEGWIQFFLKGVRTVANDAVETARKIIALREDTRQKVNDELGSMTGALPLLEHLFTHPATTANLAKDQLDISFAQANKLLNRFEELGLLVETTGQRRNRRFRFEPYLALFRSPDPVAQEGDPDTTQA